MPDVAIETSLDGTREGAGAGDSSGSYLRCPECGPVWISDQTGYTFFIGALGSGPQLYYRKTTNGGSSFGSATLAMTTGESVNGLAKFGIWYDRWTPGSTGTLIHFAATDYNDNNLYYRNLDTSSDTLSSSRVNCGSMTNIIRGDWFEGGVVSITRARGGNIYIAASNNGGGTLRRLFVRSTDSGSSFAARVVTWIEESDDYFILEPANTSDTQDIAIIKMDESANQIECRVYDDSANTVGSGVQVVALSTGDWIDDRFGFSASVRGTDGHILVAAWNAVPSATADLKFSDVTVDTTTPSSAAKTDVLTNTNNAFECSVFIDNNPATPKIYVSYIKGTTWNSAVTTFYKSSTDGGTNWSSETALGQDTEDDLRMISSGHSVKSGEAGRFYPVWVNSDLSDLLGNFTNSVAITVATAFFPPFPLFTQAVYRM